MTWIDVLSIGVGVAAVMLGVWLMTGGLAKPGRWVLAGLLVVLGAGRLLSDVPVLLWGEEAPALFAAADFVVVCVALSLHLAFAVVFTEWSLSMFRKTLLAACFFPAGILILVGFMSSGLLVNGVPSTGFGRFLALVVIASYFPALVVFAVAWLSKGSPDWRRQFLYVLLAYLLLNLNGGLVSFVSTFQDPSRFGVLLLALGFTLLILQFAGVLVVATLAFFRPVFGRLTGDDSRFMLWFSAGAVLIFLQFLGPLGPVLVEALIVGLLFWGGALVQIVDAPLQMKFGVKSGVVGGIATGTVFIVQEIVELLVAGPFGLMGGLAVATGVVVVFTPVRRFAKSVSDKSMPGVESTPQWRRQRALSLYRVALEGALRDGVIDVREASSLSALRQELGMSAEDHEAIHRQLETTLGTGNRATGRVQGPA